MDATHSRPQSAPWFWIALMWGSVGLFDATQTVFVMRAEGMHHAGVALWVTLLLCYLPWALLTPIILRLGRRYPPVRFKPVSTWMVHILACGTIHFGMAGWNAWLEAMLNP